MATKVTATKNVAINAPNMATAEFLLIGESPLVIHRFSVKTKREFEEKVVGGSRPTTGKKKHEPVTLESLFDDARYRGPDGWDGVNASSFRNALISACRLVNFKMTLAKLSLFVQADGWDVAEPQIPLVRIYGEPVLQEDIGRTSTGVAMLIVRPAYHNWRIKLRIRFDADQFSLGDVTNLLARVGAQVGIGEGRPDSKESSGMGWGLFRIADEEEARAAG